MYKVYVSFVIQYQDNHIHDYEIIDIAKDEIAIYADNTAKEVVKWSSGKQSLLALGEKLVILNFFTIPNL